VAKYNDLLLRILRGASDANIAFSQLRNLLKRLGFARAEVDRQVAECRLLHEVTLLLETIIRNRVTGQVNASQEAAIAGAVKEREKKIRTQGSTV